jgi:hypothetical protein
LVTGDETVDFCFDYPREISPFLVNKTKVQMTARIRIENIRATLLGIDCTFA